MRLKDSVDMCYDIWKEIKRRCTEEFKYEILSLKDHDKREEKCVGLKNDIVRSLYPHYEFLFNCPYCDFTTIDPIEAPCKLCPAVLIGAIEYDCTDTHCLNGAYEVFSRTGNPDKVCEIVERTKDLYYKYIKGELNDEETPEALLEADKDLYITLKGNTYRYGKDKPFARLVWSIYEYTNNKIVYNFIVENDLGQYLEEIE